MREMIESHLKQRSLLDTAVKEVLSFKDELLASVIIADKYKINFNILYTKVKIRNEIVKFYINRDKNKSNKISKHLINADIIYSKKKILFVCFVKRCRTYQ